MTDLVERFSTESLLLPDRGARVMRPRLHTVDVHWHDYYELCLVVSGEAEHVVNGVARPIGRGSAFLLSPADFHAIRSIGHEPLGCYNTVIDPGLMERQLAGLGPPSVGDFPWHTDGFLAAEADLCRLQAEFEEPRLGSARLIEALVGCLVVELARQQPVEAAVADHRPGVADELRAAVRYVDRHFREPISLADAARRAHLSPNYFSERFREHTGSSFQLYLQERRLRFAARVDAVVRDRGVSRRRFQQPLALRPCLPAPVRHRSVGPLEADVRSRSGGSRGRHNGNGRHPDPLTKRPGFGKTARQGANRFALVKAPYLPLSE
jgi:mannose-6-phosphate isomerase-like protein (cupin superfamily)